MEKQRRGITLVALVITVIILLILAGITIYMLGEQGIIKRAEQAGREYKQAEVNESKDLDDIFSSIRVAEDSKVTLTMEELDEYINRKMLQQTVQNTMSGTEHFTGEYYFNGKPIYAKTIYIDVLPDTCAKRYSHGIEDVDMIWFDFQNSTLINGEGVSVSPTYISGSVASFNSIQSVTTSDIVIQTGSNRTMMSAYITLRYTKTTDEGNGNTIAPAIEN